MDELRLKKQILRRLREIVETLGGAFSRSRGELPEDPIHAEAKRRQEILIRYGELLDKLEALKGHVTLITRQIYGLPKDYRDRERALRALLSEFEEMGESVENLRRRFDEIHLADVVARQRLDSVKSKLEGIMRMIHDELYWLERRNYNLWRPHSTDEYIQAKNELLDAINSVHERIVELSKYERTRG